MTSPGNCASSVTAAAESGIGTRVGEGGRSPRLRAPPERGFPGMVRLFGGPVPERRPEPMRHRRDPVLPEQSAHLLAAHRSAALADEHDRTPAAAQLPGRAENLQRPPAERHPVRAGGLHPARGNRPDALLPVDLAPRRPSPPSAPGTRTPARPPCPAPPPAPSRWPPPPRCGAGPSGAGRHGAGNRAPAGAGRTGCPFSSPWRWPIPAPRGCGDERSGPSAASHARWVRISSTSALVTSETGTLPILGKAWISRLGCQFLGTTALRHPARFCSITRRAASANVGMPTERRFSAIGSPPVRASLRLASETRATLPSPSSRFRPRTTSR